MLIRRRDNYGIIIRRIGMSGYLGFNTFWEMFGYLFFLIESHISFTIQILISDTIRFDERRNIVA